MTSTSDKKLAREIMDRHEGVKYTEALRFVARLKDMRERNESRAAFGVSPVIKFDPMGPDWELEETRRFFGEPIPTPVKFGGGRLDPLRFADGRVQVRALLEEQKASDREGTGGDMGLDEWHVVANAGQKNPLFEEALRAARFASYRDRVAGRLQKRMRGLTQSMSDFNLILGRPGAEKQSRLLELQLEMEKRGQSTYVMDPKAGELPDTSDSDSEV